MPTLSTRAIKGMLIHHAIVRLGWTREEITEAFDEWLGACQAHRESIGQNHTDGSARDE